MRCLYCGRRLALLKKLTDGDFCSAAHRSKYDAEQERLVLGRLAEAEQQLAKAHGQQASPSAPSEREPSSLEGLIPTVLLPAAMRYGACGLVAPLAVKPNAQRPVVSGLRPDAQLPMQAQEVQHQAEIPAEIRGESNAEPREYAGKLSMPVRPLQQPLALRATEPAVIPHSEAWHFPRVPGIPALSPSLAEIVKGPVTLHLFEGETGPLDSPTVAPLRPPRWARRPRSRKLALQARLRFVEGMVPTSLPDPLGQYPVVRDCGAYPNRLTEQPGRVALPELRESLGGRIKADCESMLALPGVAARERSSVSAALATLDASPFPRRLAIRRLKRKLVAKLDLPACGQVATPGLSGIQLPVEIKQHGITAPFWPTLLPTRPKAKLGIKPFPFEQKRSQRDLRARMQEAERKPKQTRDSLVQLWRSAPADLKWLALALPIIFIFVIQSRHSRIDAKQPGAPVVIAAPPVAISTSTVQAASTNVPLNIPASTPMPAAAALPGAPPTGLKSSLGQRWQTLQKLIASRAAVELSDDFRFGMNSWTGEKDWSKTWSYDAGGSVRTGNLAFYTPSRNLVDYRLEFLGSIDKKAIGWVFRAKDSQNYYGLKLIIEKPGPLPTAALMRFAVIDGKETAHFRVPLPMTVRNDSLYRIRTEVRGDDFTTSVQGVVVDHFTDDRLKSGGVGFFSHHGEQARLRWVEVSHQYDMLGQIFSFITPYDPQARSVLDGR